MDHNRMARAAADITPFWEREQKISMANLGFLRKQGGALDFAAALQRSPDALREALPFSRIQPHHNCLCMILAAGVDSVEATTMDDAREYLHAMGFHALTEYPHVLRSEGITEADVEEGRAFLSAQLPMPSADLLYLSRVAGA